MKALMSFYVFIISWADVCSQKIVNNEFLKNIDEYFNVIDSLMPKNDFTTVDIYVCNPNVENPDSCMLFSQKRFDRSGRLVEFSLGDNLMSNRVDYCVRYRRVNDTLFEGIITYPKESTLIEPNFFVDTTINRKQERIFLYKRDTANNLIVKSMYFTGSKGNLLKIERYDIDNKLVHVYYPLGNRKAVKERKDTSTVGGKNQITETVTFDENEYTERRRYSANGKLLFQRSINYTFRNNYRNELNKGFFYDKKNRLIGKVLFDENNLLIEEERFEYVNEHLSRHTRDTDFQDDKLEEEYKFETGKLVESSYWNKYEDRNTRWKIDYYSNGLRFKENYFVDGSHRSTKIYVYK